MTRQQQFEKLMEVTAEHIFAESRRRSAAMADPQRSYYQSGFEDGYSAALSTLKGEGDGASPSAPASPGEWFCGRCKHNVALHYIGDGPCDAAGCSCVASVPDPFYDSACEESVSYLSDSNRVRFHQQSDFSEGCVAIAKAFVDGATWARLTESAAGGTPSLQDRAIRAALAAVLDAAIEAQDAWVSLTATTAYNKVMETVPPTAVSAEKEAT